ncbi:MAG TPA: hypothetical protein VI815_03220 [Candidatus Nanoarchaeia archaeon]|nr:hypothetical protein [Candidatus Nanoarchaeia archaeon]
MRTKKRTVIFCATLLILSVLLISVSVSALTAKIGNGRMILNTEVGEKIEKSIRVINDNDVSVNITLFPSGDLMNNTDIIDDSFILQPGEEKNARFTVYSNSIGRYETKVNVQFNPTYENENGAGLSSQIILNVYAKGELPNTANNLRNSSENAGAYVLGGLALVLVIVAITLLYISRKKRVKNGGEFSKLKFNEKHK